MKGARDLGPRLPTVVRAHFFFLASFAAFFAVFLKRR